ncbi:hypothetical protein CXB51_022191 [Gossypium anomalum]|uniref:Uncharacterized protein n=1 Tax=Gossypium anomalum TaxID=47600 RepID=A0A8J5Y5N2_9ROSI|nr:hypothetical protein CXB51_022191 [Gossypium anomalum]
MASSTSKLAFRIVLAALILLALFYVGPSALLEDLRHRPRHPPQQTNRISQIMLEAQRSVGWFNDEADSGIHENRGKQASRRLKFRVL